MLRLHAALFFVIDAGIRCSAGIAIPTNAPSDYSSKKYEYHAEGKIAYKLESFEGWHSIFKVNTFEPFFVTTAFLELLEKGARSCKDGTSGVINIKVISFL
jgi:NAD(P)-dependent dehydrogenase (short-subunit alcohol dehydrogenase family)